MSNFIAWSMVGLTILLTTYGQLVIKWQVMKPIEAPLQALSGWPPLLLILLRPWVISALAAAFLASLCWMVAMSKLELSRAYPFMALNFLLVGALAVPLFGESLNRGKLVGITLVVLGLVVVSRS